jgi:hypothetical protein
MQSASARSLKMKQQIIIQSSEFRQNLDEFRQNLDEFRHNLDEFKQNLDQI